MMYKREKTKKKNTVKIAHFLRLKQLLMPFKENNITSPSSQLSQFESESWTVIDEWSPAFTG